MKIVILGPDGAGKSTVINQIMENLTHNGRSVNMRHLKPQFISWRRDNRGIVVTNPHGKPLRSTPTSLAKISVWLIEEWCANILQDKKKTLLICDRYYHDLLIDPIRYRYGGPLWIAKLVGMLMPHPDLWILLDAPAEVLQTRKQEVPLAETARQRIAYLTFVRNQKHKIVVDASQSMDLVISNVMYAITNETH